MTTMNLAGLAAHLLTAKADMKWAEGVALERVCRMLEKSAKDAIGTYRFDWPQLQPETIARKATGDKPLLETGALRDSITHNADADGKDAYVGTDDPVAKYHEFGTSHIPARPFLGGALHAKESKIGPMVARTISAALSIGGPNYRELHELLHLAHGLYHEAKELGESLVDDEDARSR
jgi:HK97 gp10 family phage protein